MRRQGRRSVKKEDDNEKKKKRSVMEDGEEISGDEREGHKSKVN
jgi:hypothetical protein